MGATQREQGRQAGTGRPDVAELLANVSEGVLAIGTDEVLRYANASAARMLATRRERLVGSALPLPGCGGERDPVDAALRQVLAGNRPSTFLGRIGPVRRWCEVRALPTRDGLVAYLRGVEAEQRAEGRRLELAARLHRRDGQARALLELTRALAAAPGPAAIAAAATAQLRAVLGPVRAALWVLDRDGRPRSAPGPGDPAGADRVEVLRGSDGSTLGALALAWDRPRPLDASERTFLGIVTGICAQALQVLDPGPPAGVRLPPAPPPPGCRPRPAAGTTGTCAGPCARARRRPPRPAG